MPSTPDKKLENRFGVNDLEVTAEQEVEFLDRQWTLLPTVYPMQQFRSTRFFWRQLSHLHAVNRFLEVGSGSGAISVMAASTGLCQTATALDINANAVRNTVVNAQRHGVADEVKAVRSDLFTALSKDDRYDLIFWNSNGVFIDEGTALTDHERSFFDPGYQTHVRYLSEGIRHLTPSGRLTLGFCGRGDLEVLRREAAALGLGTQILAEDQEGSHPHWLLEFEASS
jgi:release factor glutamine methyltransferase